MTHIKETLTEIFKPPFVYDSMAMMILDSNGQNIVDIRGYGRLQYHENAEERQDEIGREIAEFLNIKAKHP
jgi:hypothetical protein